MVLSNKKLKQKIRAAVAESLAATEAAKQESSLHAQSLKQLLSDASQKQRLSKREKKRKNLSLKGESNPSEGTGDTQTEKREIGLMSKKAKKKKRKREDGGTEDTQIEKKEIAFEDVENKGAEDKESGLKKRKKRKKEGDGKENGGPDELKEKKPAKKNKKNKKKKKKEKEKKEEKEIQEEKEMKDGSIKGEGVEEAVNFNESQESETNTKVYVGGIPYYSTEDDIQSFFMSCGTITELDCMTFPETGKFRGIAIITFKTEAAAKRALALDGAEMGELFLKIQPYKFTRAQQRSSDFAPEIIEGYNRIYVGNLSWDITEDDLKKLFSDCTISSIRFGTDKTTGEFRGYAHVDFSDSISLAMALKLDQRVVCERPVRIRCAVPKKQTPKKEVESHSEDSSKNVGADNSDNSKKKRRTCYECGVPGHLSSSCPKKKVVE